MSEFFKTLLKGVIYVLLLPVIVAFLALVFVYCVLIFIYMAFRNLIVFFSGGTPNGDLPEDVEAKKRIQARFMVQETAQADTVSEDSKAELVTPDDIAEDGELSPVLEEKHEEIDEEGGDDDGDTDPTYRI